MFQNISEMKGGQGCWSSQFSSHILASLAKLS